MSSTKRNILIVGNALSLVGDIALQFALEGDKPLIVDTRGGGAQAIADGFDACALAPPVVLCSAAEAVRDARRLCALACRQAGGIDALIFQHTHDITVNSIEDYDKDLLWDSVEQNTWPIIEYTKQIRAACGRYPKYVLGISAFRPDRAADHLDFTVAAHSLNEVFVKYLNYHLYGEGVIFNMINISEDDSGPYRKAVARGLFALTSGLMDAVRGQTIAMPNDGSFRSQA